VCFRISSSASSSETDAKDSALPFSPNRSMYETRKKLSHFYRPCSFQREPKIRRMKKKTTTNVDENCAISNSTAHGQCSQNTVLPDIGLLLYATSGRNHRRPKFNFRMARKDEVACINLCTYIIIVRLYIN